MKLAKQCFLKTGFGGYVYLKDHKESKILKDTGGVISGNLHSHLFEVKEKDFGLFLYNKNKFDNERVLVKNAEVFLAIDGLILNKNRLKREYNAISFSDAIDQMIKKKGPYFVTELRGNFVGFLYDRMSHKAFLFVDHIGTKWLFYSYDSENGLLIFSSKLEYITDAFLKLGKSLKLNEIGAHCMLTLGYMLEDQTIVENIYKIKPGTIYEFFESSLREHKYYQVDNTNITKQKPTEIIEELDSRFRTSTEDEFNKDTEYGYDHLCTLSGGLDSRMVVGSALRYGFDNLTSFTMSQSGYYDDTIAKIFASDLGINHIFVSLDNGDYLTEIEEGAKFQEGLVLYSGSAHLLFALRNIDMSNYGIIHTGMVGDGIFGTFLISPKILKPSQEKMDIHSNSYDFKEFYEKTYKSYDNSELFKIYSKVVNAVYNGFRNIEGFSEYSSAFLYNDFMDYSFKIPPELRYKKKIYKEWVIKKNPILARYPLESRFGMSFDSNDFLVLVRRIERKLRGICIGQSWKDSMNPMEYWYKINENVKNTFNQYYKNNIDMLSGHISIAKETKRVFSSKVVADKTKALTLLYAVKHFNLS